MSELGKVIVTMGRDAERHEDRHCEEISEQADRHEERHQSDLQEILRMFSEENSKCKWRFYADLLTQQGRALAEINAVNATNAEFLRGLQDATLGVIAMMIQQRQGINVQGDTSHTMQTLDMQEGTPEVVTPAEEQEETPANEAADAVDRINEYGHIFPKNH